MFDQGALPSLWPLIAFGIMLFAMIRFLRSASSQMEGRIEPESSREFPRLPEKADAAFPSALTLVPLESPGVFANMPLASEAESVLVASGGMTFVGDYAIREFPGLSIRVFTHTGKSLVAILYHDREGRSWLNLLTEYTDGRVITTSSAPEELINRDRPRGMPLFNHPGFEPSQLLRRHKLSTRTAELKAPVSPENFPLFFGEVYARLKDHMDAAAKTAEEDKSVLGTLFPFPQTLGGAKREERNTPSLEDPSPETLERWLAAAYRVSGVQPEKRRKFRENLVWVMEGAPMESIARTITMHSNVSVVKKGASWIVHDDMEKENPFDPENLSGPALFEKLNSAIPESSRFQRLDAGIKNTVLYWKE